MNNLTQHFVNYLSSAREHAESDASSVKGLKCVARDFDPSKCLRTRTQYMSVFVVRLMCRQIRMTFIKIMHCNEVLENKLIADLRHRCRIFILQHFCRFAIVCDAGRANCRMAEAG